MALSEYIDLIESFAQYTQQMTDPENVADQLLSDIKLNGESRITDICENEIVDSVITLNDYRSDESYDDISFVADLCDIDIDGVGDSQGEDEGNKDTTTDSPRDSDDDDDKSFNFIPLTPQDAVE
eukprot:253032_1